MEYKITENQLNAIVEWARTHPNEEFYTESMGDEIGVFLSCTFFDENDYSESGYWELDEVES